MRNALSILFYHVSANRDKKMYVEYDSQLKPLLHSSVCDERKPLQFFFTNATEGPRTQPKYKMQDMRRKFIRIQIYLEHVVKLRGCSRFIQLILLFSRNDFGNTIYIRPLQNSESIECCLHVWRSSVWLRAVNHFMFSMNLPESIFTSPMRTRCKSV